MTESSPDWTPSLGSVLSNGTLCPNRRSVETRPPSGRFPLGPHIRGLEQGSSPVSRLWRRELLPSVEKCKSASPGRLEGPMQHTILHNLNTEYLDKACWSLVQPKHGPECHKLPAILTARFLHKPQALSSAVQEMLLVPYIGISKPPPCSNNVCGGFQPWGTPYSGIKKLHRISPYYEQVGGCV
jgi:hypothetical protein